MNTDNTNKLVGWKRTLKQVNLNDHNLVADLC